MAGMMWRASVLFSILASLLKSMQGSTNPDDMKGLRLFFSSVNSPPLLTGWNDSEGDPCMDSWKGITCDEDVGSVTQIELSGLMLDGTLRWSSSLSRLQNLRVLDLSNNQLIGVIPYNLPRKIELLNLQRNHLERSIPWSLGELVFLTELRLAHNNLSGPVTDIFGKLGSLITLDLSDNAFTGGIPRTLGNVSHLSFLHLQGNEIDTGLDVLTNLKSLQAVDIRENAFHGEGIPSQLWAIPNFQFSAKEFSNNDSLPSNQFNVSLIDSPAPSPFPGVFQPITSPRETYISGPPAQPPRLTSGTDFRDPEDFPFWYPERIAGVSVVSVLAVVVIVLIIMIFNLRNKDKEQNQGASDLSW